MRSSPAAKDRPQAAAPRLKNRKARARSAAAPGFIRARQMTR
jgi:hypothetical protein